MTRGLKKSYAASGGSESEVSGIRDKSLPMEEDVDDPLITIGRVVREWGIKGELLVEPLTFDPDRFLRLREIAVSVGKGFTVTRHRLIAVRSHGKFLVVSISGSKDSEEARQYRGAQIQVRRSESPTLPEGVYYQYDIIGLRVFTADGLDLGRIRSILETGSNDVYVVRGSDMERLVPAIKDVVLHIDLKAGVMTVALPETVEE